MFQNRLEIFFIPQMLLGIQEYQVAGSQQRELGTGPCDMAWLLPLNLGSGTALSSHALPLHSCGAGSAGEAGGEGV